MQFETEKQTLSFSDRWILLLEEKKNISLGLLALVITLGAWIGYSQSGPTVQQYVAAQDAFAQWKHSPQEEALYQKAQKAMQKLPLLQAKYESAFAQKLLDLKKTAEAMPLAHQSLKRVHQETPFHAAFAAGSLLIEQGEYQEALEQTVALKEALAHFLETQQIASDSLRGGTVLYAHALIRIACLQQQLQNSPGEKVAWEEVEAFLQGKPEKNELANLVLKGFTDSHIDLSVYLQERKKQI